jgi:dihydropteroate synthase
MLEPPSIEPPLLEPAGLLHGIQAREAIRAGVALPLQGGGSAFCLVRTADGAFLPVPGIPEAWRDRLQRLVEAPPAAGLPPGPLVMGILNATPDSFSDGGRHLAVPDAVAAGVAMIAAGAAILDIGGESTRPGAAEVDPEQEQARVLPVLAGLRQQGGLGRALISIDTRNGSTMRAALDAGADLINDVSALSHDPAAAGLLAAYDCPVVLTHSRGTPATMNGLAQYNDVAVEVVRELERRIGHAVQAGIARSRLIVDPGIGFAKNAAQNLELLRRLPMLANLGCRVLLGTSRKGFIGQVAGVADAAERNPGSIVSSLPALALPGCILRVHDVSAMMQAMRLWQAMQG